MPDYKVLKKVVDKQTGAVIGVGTVISRTEKQISDFERSHGKGYFEKVTKTEKKKKGA